MEEAEISVCSRDGRMRSQSAHVDLTEAWRAEVPETSGVGGEARGWQGEHRLAVSVSGSQTAGPLAALPADGRFTL